MRKVSAKPTDPRAAKREGLIRELQGLLSEIGQLEPMLKGKKDRVQFLQGAIAAYNEILETPVVAPAADEPAAPDQPGNGVAPPPRNRAERRRAAARS